VGEEVSAVHGGFEREEEEGSMVTRKSPITHRVKAHTRKTKKGRTFIPSHVRGHRIAPPKVKSAPTWHVKPQVFMLQKEVDEWRKYPDAVLKSKKVGSFHVELLGGTERGAHINIWEHERSTLHHVFTPSDDDKWMKVGEVNFMHYGNAVEEYRQLKSVRDVLDLMQRNG